MTPYYEEKGITIYHADCREALPLLTADVLVTDPPYGINYASSSTGHDGGVALPGIQGDSDCSLRDYVLSAWANRPAIVFGSRKRPVPANCRAVLIWDKGDHVGMGDLSIPWKPNTEEIYVIGNGFSGRRSSSVLSFDAPVTWNSIASGRLHPHEKPRSLMIQLISKCPIGVVLDPFMGSGTTLRAAKDLGRKAIGIEIEEKYCDIAAKRLSQQVLQFEHEEQREGICSGLLAEMASGKSPVRGASMPSLFGDVSGSRATETMSAVPDAEVPELRESVCA